MIVQGVTPKITLKCNNFNPTTLTKIEIIIKNGDTIIEKVHKDLQLTENTISFYLTQRETLNLNPRKDVFIQLRAYTGTKLPNGDDEVKATVIKQTDVYEFIGQGVL